MSKVCAICGKHAVAGRSISFAQSLRPPPACYAIAYLGAVADDDDVFRDALILEFGERGAECGYSAFSLVEGIGAGDNLAWSDPAPAGGPLASCRARRRSSPPPHRKLRAPAPASLEPAKPGKNGLNRDTSMDALVRKATYRLPR